MLAGRRELPVEGRGDSLALKRVGHLLAGEQAAAVDPRPEIGRDGDVGRRRHDAAREFAIATPDLVEDVAEAALRRHGRLDRDGELVRHGKRRRLEPPFPALRERHAVEESLHVIGRDAESLELVPFVAFTHVLCRPIGLDLRRGHQAGVVVLVPGHGQAEPLHRVADEAGRLVARGVVEGFQHRRQIVAAEIVHQRRQLRVGALRDQP